MSDVEKIAEIFGKTVARMYTSAAEEILRHQRETFDDRAELKEKQEILNIRIQGKTEEERILQSQRNDRLRLKGDADLEDYKRFLGSMAQIRKSLKESFPNTPDIFLDLVHERFKAAFEKMRSTEDPRSFISLFNAVQDDLYRVSLGEVKTPAATLKEITES